MKLYQKDVTVGDIFRNYFDQYLLKYGPLPKHYYKAANAIIQCRTEHMGGHIYKCDTCSHEIALYNSCRNRHCPQCGAMARAKWVEKRMNEALPVNYYHVVFTIPHQLNSIVLRNKKNFYQLMFKAVSETLLELGLDPKYLGGQIGFVAVLHSWGQNLMDHPHIHCMIPAGALDTKKDTWKPGKKRFLFPVAVMQKLFRGKIMAYLTKAVSNGTINPMFVATDQCASYRALVDKLYTIKWVVYVKEPFTSPGKLIKYQARYINRVSIANTRILKLENSKVTFLYKDYADNNTIKTLTITAVEFIRRFMLHIFPEGFMHIRQYGFLSNAAKRKKLSHIRELIKQQSNEITEMSREDIKADEAKQYNVFKCPLCEKGTLIKGREIEKVGFAPTKVVND